MVLIAMGNIALESGVFDYSGLFDEPVKREFACAGICNLERNWSIFIEEALSTDLEKTSSFALMSYGVLDNFGFFNGGFLYGKG
jgi:hypothetical protein